MGILDEAKSLVSTIQKIDNIELYKQILDLQGEIFKVVQENTDLKSAIVKLQKEIELKGNLRFAYNAYWLGDVLEEADGPFCSHCHDVKRLLVRLHTMPTPKFSECPSCKKTLQVPRKENAFDRSPDETPRVSINLPPRRDLSGF